MHHPIAKRYRAIRSKSVFNQRVLKVLNWSGEIFGLYEVGSVYSVLRVHELINVLMIFPLRNLSKTLLYLDVISIYAFMWIC